MGRFGARGREVDKVRATAVSLRGLGRLFIVAAMMTPSMTACTYGREVEGSEFEDAELLPGGQILFSFKFHRFRPATGFNAFPDGGMSLDIASEKVLGVYDPNAQRITIVQRDSSQQWGPYDGQFSIVEVRPPNAIVRRGALASEGTGPNKDLLLNTNTWSAKPFPSIDEISAGNAQTSEEHLVSPFAHVLVVSYDVNSSTGATRLTIRNPDGQRVTIGTPEERPILHGLRGDEIIYYAADQKLFRAYNVYSMTTRTIPNPYPLEPSSVTSLQRRTTQLRWRNGTVGRAVSTPTGETIEPTGLTTEAVLRALGVKPLR